jgi:hypothetical protein
LPRPDQLRQPEWHPVRIDGEELHWRKYPSWQCGDDGSWQRCWSLEVARSPNALGVGSSYPAGTVVGEEHVRALVRVVKEHGEPIL